MDQELVRFRQAADRENRGRRGPRRLTDPKGKVMFSRVGQLTPAEEKELMVKLRTVSLGS